MRSSSIVVFLFLIEIITSHFVHAQPKHHTLSIEIFSGKILDHSPHIPNGLIDNNPLGLVIDYEEKTSGNRPWTSKYGYPDIGYSLLYLDYRNSELGKTIGIAPYLRFYLLGKNISTNALKLKVGFGATYHTNPYNNPDNLRNVMLGSSLSYAANIQLEYHHKIGEKLNAQVGYAFTHFSNGAIKKPNLGINMTSYNLGLGYRLNKDPAEYNNMEPEVGSRKLKLAIVAAFGWNESEEFKGRGAHPFYNIGAQVSKRLSYKSGIHVGTELFLTTTIKNDIEIDANGSSDYKRAGAYLGYELFVSKISLIAQLGYHFYRPYVSYTRAYKRLGLNYSFNDHVLLGLALKSYTTKAEAAEFRFGYTF